MKTEHPHGARGLPARRVFVVGSELPGLLFGALRGEPVRLRRILGARGAGRYGVLLAALGLALACAPRHWPALLAGHALGSLAGWAVSGRNAGLGLRQHQRLLLWAVAGPLGVAAVLRLGLVLAGARLGADPHPYLAGAALAIGHGVLVRHLGRNRPFGPTASDPRHPA